MAAQTNFQLQNTSTTNVYQTEQYKSFIQALEETEDNPVAIPALLTVNDPEIAWYATAVKTPATKKLITRTVPFMQQKFIKPISQHDHIVQQASKHCQENTTTSPHAQQPLDSKKNANMPEDLQKMGI